MCGIFGYVGQKNNAANFILDGLKLLEYRGYDSWGIAVKNGEKLAIEKHIGKIGDASVSLPDSTIGIGHTRWATHGGVTDTNAHPHLDCKKEIAVIHNGIIENYSEIKKELVDKGHIFISETDTEVAAHLIEENLQKNDFPTAVRNAFNRFTGMNAIVVFYAPSQEIVAAKNGSPLVIGKGTDGLYLASDITALLPHTKEIYYTNDGEMIVLNQNAELYVLESGEKRPLRFETTTLVNEDSDKRGYEHYMLKEIHEQADVIHGIAASYEKRTHDMVNAIKQANGIFFIGAGTASYASLAGVYLFSKIAGMHVNMSVASEFMYLEDFLYEKSLIIAFSQSGETIDVVEPLTKAKKKRAKIGAIVNTEGSSIYRLADIRILLHAGPERAVASTKAYTAKLSILIALCYQLAQRQDDIKELLSKTALEIKRLLDKPSLTSIRSLAEQIKDREHVYVIGRGASFPAALEAALKIKEVSYIHAEGFAGGELKHGTIALIEKGTPCIVFAPNDETNRAIISNATEIKARGGFIVGVGPKKEDIFDVFIEVQDLGDASLIAQIIPIQVLAYHLALLRNCDPDKPRNLAKSVTVK